MNSWIGLVQEHRETDLCACGPSRVMLRNSWYRENSMEQLSHALTRGTYLGATKNARITAIQLSDAAEATAATLPGEGYACRTYELTGEIPFTRERKKDPYRRGLEKGAAMLRTTFAPGFKELHRTSVHGISDALASEADRRETGQSRGHRFRHWSGTAE